MHPYYVYRWMDQSESMVGTDCRWRQTGCGTVGPTARGGGGAEHLAIAAWHLDGVEHVQEADRLVIGHVRVPVLPGVGDPDRLAVLDDVREKPDLRHPGLVVPAGQRGLDPAEAPREVPELDGLEPLIRKSQHAVAAERQEERGEVRVAQGFGEVGPPDRRPQDLSARLDSRHAALLMARRDYTAPGSSVNEELLQGGRHGDEGGGLSEG